MERDTVYKTTIIFLMNFTFLGCATAVTTERFDEIMTQKVKKKAAFDFQCPEEKLTINKLDFNAYGATGCEMRSSFQVVPTGSFVCEPKFHTEETATKRCTIFSDTTTRNE
jgi:hypothetical protein